MYCVKCGNKIKNTDIYCSKCGNKINREVSQDDTTKQPSSKTLSMVWYNFFTYVRLPIGIIISIISLLLYNYSSFIYDKIALGICFINIAMLIFYCLSLYMLHFKKKETMIYIVIELVIECISVFINSTYYLNDILSSIISLILIFAIWFVPNYIYFNKRKNIFIN